MDGAIIHRRRSHLFVVSTLLAAVLLALVLAGSSRATTAEAAVSSLEAEKMRFPSSSGVVSKNAGASGGEALLLRSNGSATGGFTGPANRVIIRARGDQCEGAPRMLVRIDGVRVMSTLVQSKVWKDYTADVEVQEGDHSVHISYTNDHATATCDRNLRLDNVTFEAPDTQPPPGSLPALSVVGNHLEQAGRPGPFYFHGVNRDTLEWGQNPTGSIDWSKTNWGGCGGDGHFTDADYDNIASWGANTVRIPLSQANWLGRRCDPEAYARMVDDVVAKANARGMYAILDLHWSDVGGRAPCIDDSTCLSGQQPMPDADSVTFWDQVAARYANNPGVMFNLHNEPYIWKQPWVYNYPDDADWRCWRDGGCTAYASEQTSPKDSSGKAVPVPYTAVGMQELYDTVRARAPKNVVIIAGLDWASDLSGIGRGFGVNGSNIVYDIHVYTQWHNTVPDWDEHFGFLTDTHAVASTEFGSINCSTDVTSKLIDYLDAPMGDPSRRMSWTIWSWNTPGECSQPTVLADWDGAPLAGQGRLVQEKLKSYARARGEQVCGETKSVLADADSWIEQSDPNKNVGSDSVLKIRSKGGGQNTRALVSFPLPAVEAGCKIVGAKLRLHSPSPKGDRTLQALRVAGSWSESGVTWNNQPATAGAEAATTTVHGPSTLEWNVTSQVKDMYSTANHGFMIRDAVENDTATSPEQSLNGRETPTADKPPELVITFGNA